MPSPFPFRSSHHASVRAHALVASADRSFRQRLAEILTGLRWQVREAEGGAQAWTEAQSSAPRHSSSTHGFPILT